MAKRRPPHVWSGVTKRHLQQMQDAQSQLVTLIDTARDNLNWQEKAALTVMETMQKHRKDSGQSVKVK